MYLREIINTFWAGQVSLLVKIFDFGIFSDTINVINVKVCMMVKLTFSDLDCISESLQSRICSLKILFFYPVKLNLCRIGQ